MHLKEKYDFVFYHYFNKMPWQHNSRNPQNLRNLASSIFWHHLNKVWCELRDSSRKNRQ